MIHCTSETSLNTPTVIGNRVVIGVGATVHGCTLEDECEIGDMATVLDGAIVKRHAIVAAGSVVSPNTVIPSRQLWSGIPARFERELTSEEIKVVGFKVMDALELSTVHATEQAKGWEEIWNDEEQREENENRNPFFYQKPNEEVGAMLRRTHFPLNYTCYSPMH
jgi:gamma-carbonic anhydrase